MHELPFEQQGMSENGNAIYFVDKARVVHHLGWRFFFNECLQFLIEQGQHPSLLEEIDSVKTSKKFDTRWIWRQSPDISQRDLQITQNSVVVGSKSVFGEPCRAFGHIFDPRKGEAKVDRETTPCTNVSATSTLRSCRSEASWHNFLHLRHEASWSPCCTKWSN